MAFRMLCLLFSLLACLQSARAADVSIDFGNTHAISPLLYGIFFEEINHAGEGGLYAELIQDRSFDALAVLTSFRESQEESQELDSSWFERQPRATATVTPAYNSLQGQSAKEFLPKNQSDALYAQPESWIPFSSTKVYLTKTDPINPQNLVALNVTAYNSGGGVSNRGFWGIPVEDTAKYHLSFFVKGDKKSQVAFSACDHAAKVQVVLKGQSGIYAEASFKQISAEWQHVSATLESNATDHNAELSVVLLEPGSIVIDSVSLFPEENIRKGWQNPFPFRKDLLQKLKDLNPRFVRFPGGCYVEGGDWLRNRFPWRTNLGPNSNRTGHLNQIWGYWSSDGLGLYEYMLLSEELEAEPVYVVNNGISHQEATPVERIKPFIDETLDALEFILGSSESTYGGIRAQMGRKEPWQLNYLAIGNEDCGHPWYTEDYNAFYFTIKALYPHITLIANCPLLDGGKTELWDWHSYDNSQNMFNRRHEFDNMRPGVDPDVFVSEYAVTADGGHGNLRGAVAEAGFMTGMERNSQVIKLASYAPLFTHAENRAWNPDMIVFDSHRVYDTPSYLVQTLFSKFQGEHYVQTIVDAPKEGSIAASTTCQDSKCSHLAVKIINFDSSQQSVSLSARGGHGSSFDGKAVIHTVTGPFPEAENSFDQPENVKLSRRNVEVNVSQLQEANGYSLPVPSMCVTVLELFQSKPSADADPHATLDVHAVS